MVKTRDTPPHKLVSYLTIVRQVGRLFHPLWWVLGWAAYLCQWIAGLYQLVPFPFHAASSLKVTGAGTDKLNFSLGALRLALKVT